jgi:hypothetical protein
MVVVVYESDAMQNGMTVLLTVGTSSGPERRDPRVISPRRDGLSVFCCADITMFFVRATFRGALQAHTKHARFLATAADDFIIPVINFEKFRIATSDSEKKAVANEIVSAFKKSGFIYLRGHGIPAGE